MSIVATDVAGHLETQLNISYPSVTWHYDEASANNIYHGPETPPDADATTGIPHQCIFVTPTGGPPVVAYLKDGGKMVTETVQVLVRGKPLEWDEPLAIATAVHNALDANPPSGYYDCQTMNGGPQPFGRDDQGHYKFIGNFALSKRV